MKISHQTLWNAFKQWACGYSKDTIKISFQIFIAYIALVGIIAPVAVWHALSYGIIVPAFALVFLVLIAPSDAGSAALGCIYLLSGFLVGGGAALIPTYLAFWANGNSFESSATKAVVFTIITAILAAMLNSLRWWWDATNQFFYLAAIGLLICGGMSTYWIESYIAWEAIFYTLALAAMAGVAATLSCWFLFPVTAGSKYRLLMNKSLAALADSLATLEPLMLGPIDAITGQLEAANGVVDPSTGVDLGIAHQVMQARGFLTAARAALVASSALHLPVLVEIDVYPLPRIFPRAAFMHIKLGLNLAIASIGGLLRLKYQNSLSRSSSAFLGIEQPAEQVVARIMKKRSSQANLSAMNNG